MKKDGKKTRLQWLKEGRAIKEGAVGEECYTGAQNGKKAVYYGIEQTTADKRKVAKAKRKEAERKEAVEEHERLQALLSESEYQGYHTAILMAVDAMRLDDPDFVHHPHTAWQWVEAGFVPRVDAVWVEEANGYRYCSWWDVRYEPERAAELAESGPREVDRLPDGRPYDGRPWW